MVRAHCIRPSSFSLVALTFFSLVVLGTTGCAMNQAFIASAPSSPAAQHIQGTVYGGQQPLVGASIQLYAAGSPTSGGSYGGGSTLLNTGTVTTDINGDFTITGDYNLPASPSYFYIVSTGGSPGNGNPANPDIVLMAAISNCTATSTLSSSLFININEVSTAAAILELQPYIAAPTGSQGAPVLIGSPTANNNDLRTAFKNVGNLVNLSTGAVVNPTGSKGQLINTLADILAYCVNSNPGGDNHCSTLFADAPSSGPTAGDTTQAAWYIAQNPTNNVSPLFGLISPSPPFTALSSAPASFAVSAPTDSVACFAILGNSAVGNTTTSPTVISGGDLGIYPATLAAVTGFTFSSTPGLGAVTAPATEYIDDSVAEEAQSDLTSAYNYAQGLGGAISLTGQDLGSLGAPLTPGVYNFSAAAGLTGTLTLNAQNNPDAVFIFQIGSTLTTATSSQVVLQNGALAQNVFWQVGSTATLGINSTFEGTIMANASVTLLSGVTLQGRALASTAAVTLNDDTVTAP
jgi:hypothetical protein